LAEAAVAAASAATAASMVNLMSKTHLLIRWLAVGEKPLDTMVDVIRSGCR
jgi:hypothetical protein